MAGGRTSGQAGGERASGTVELVALSATVALLLASMSGALDEAGPAIGTTMGTRMRQLVAAADTPTDAATAPRATATRATATATATPTAPRAAGATHAGAVLADWDLDRRGAREQRWGGGTMPARVPRDELRMSPVLPPLALWRREATRAGALAGSRWRLGVEACVACAGLDWRAAPHSGLSTGSRRSQDERLRPGVGLDATTRAHAALVGVEASAAIERRFGPVGAAAHGRARGLVGADAEGRALLDVDRDRQRLELRGGAMAGAVARAEGGAGVELLGIAISQSGRAEGWAGAGARGVLHVERDQQRLQWPVGWGAALGLGGAAEWSGTVDASQAARRGQLRAHADIARRSLRAAMFAAQFGPSLAIAATGPFLDDRKGT